MRKILLAVLFVAFCPLLHTQQSLNNDSVVKLVKAGLSEDLVVNTINSSPGTYDTSPGGIADLKSAGVPDKVISSIVAKSSATESSQAATSSAAVAEKAAPDSRAPNATPMPNPSGQPKVFIKAESDFAVALTAAFTKKQVPAIVVTDEKAATYILQSAAVASKQESTGSKWARCLLASCAGIEGTSSVSVQLIHVGDGAVAWAYQVRKGNGGPVGIQSLSEAVAKHLKNDFLAKKK